MTRRLITKEDILGAFSVEPCVDRQTLERYIRDYPEQASALVDLAQQIDLITNSESAELTNDDNALIDTAWRKHATAFQPASADILKSLTLEKQREVARSLSIPRQVITAFRDGKITLSSVPNKFLRKLADALGSTIEDLTASLTSPRLSTAKSYKADDKPFDSGQVTLEQVLTEAGVDLETRRQILDDVT